MALFFPSQILKTSLIQKSYLIDLHIKIEPYSNVVDMRTSHVVLTIHRYSLLPNLGLMFGPRLAKNQRLCNVTSYMKCFMWITSRDSHLS